MTKVVSESVDRVLNDARKDTRKGRYYVYEEYKSRLQGLDISYREYEQAIYSLTKILRV